jgi:hypothetical protein
MGTGSVSLLPLELTAADAAAEQTVDWRRDGRRPDVLVYIAMHTVKLPFQYKPRLDYVTRQTTCVPHSKLHGLHSSLTEVLVL